jgi:hypothetical protein
MTSVRRVLGIGVLLGLLGVVGQLVLLWLNLPPAVRAAFTFSLAVLIGALAGFTAKGEALKAAGLAGFVTGTMVTAVGMVLMLQNPAMIGNRPFASAETALSFVSSVLAGVVISSWLVAAIAVLIALPISQTLRRETNGL